MNIFLLYFYYYLFKIICIFLCQSIVQLNKRVKDPCSSCIVYNASERFKNCLCHIIMRILQINSDCRYILRYIFLSVFVFVFRCAICMCEYSIGDPIRFLPCLHIYHQECIDDWLLRSFTCPLCTEPVDAALISTFYTSE